MKKRLLLALALTFCSASAFAVVPARTGGDNVCTPHQDDDCDASSGSVTPAAPRPATTTTPSTTATAAPKPTLPQRRNRTDGVRNSTMRFQSYLPGMFR